MTENLLERDYLADRQNQFAAVLGVEAELLRHLELCMTCNGQDYEWTDWDVSEVTDSCIDDPAAYRSYLADTCCKDCGGTGFEGGSFKLDTQQWLTLGQGK